MNDLNQKNKIEIIHGLVNDIDNKIAQLLEISKGFPSATRNARQLKAIIEMMKAQYPAIDWQKV